MDRALNTKENSSYVILSFSMVSRVTRHVMTSQKLFVVSKTMTLQSSCFPGWSTPFHEEAREFGPEFTETREELTLFVTHLSGFIKCLNSSPIVDDQCHAFMINWAEWEFDGGIDPNDKLNFTKNNAITA